MSVEEDSAFSDFNVTANVTLEAIPEETVNNSKWDSFFSVVTLLTILINAIVIYVVVFKLAKTRLRPVTLLVSHLSLVTIGQAVVYLLNTSDSSQFINVPGALCSLVSFLRSKHL